MILYLAGVFTGSIGATFVVCLFASVRIRERERECYTEGRIDEVLDAARERV